MPTLAPAVGSRRVARWRRRWLQLSVQGGSRAGADVGSSCRFKAGRALVPTLAPAVGSRRVARWCRRWLDSNLHSGTITFYRPAIPHVRSGRSTRCTGISSRAVTGGVDLGRRRHAGRAASLMPDVFARDRLVSGGLEDFLAFL